MWMMSVEAPRMSGSDLEADFTAFFEAEYERLSSRPCT